MAIINLYKIESNKTELFLQEIENGDLELKNSITIEKEKNKGEVYLFDAILYVEEPHETEDGISWNWLLQEFDEKTYTVHKAPKAVLLIEKYVKNDVTDTYAISFGNSFFKIDKYCDRDFGLRFASRIDYEEIKTTTLIAPNLKRNKTINTYVNYKELDFDSGESFSKLKVNAKLDENFDLFKHGLDIGNSIRFNTENETVSGIIDIIMYVEKVLEIPDEKAKNKIPLFKIIKDDETLNVLNSKLEQELFETVFGDGDTHIFSFPELEIVGATEILNRTDSEFALTFPKKEKKKINSLSVELIREFCRENDIKTMEDINKIKIKRYKDGEAVVTVPLKNIIEYTDDEYKCIFSNNRWYYFNHDYENYLNSSVKKIDAIYNPKYDFSDEIHNKFKDEKFEELKYTQEYADMSEKEIRDKIANTYYAEYSYNLLREKEDNFTCYDRENTSTGFEKMDLYQNDKKIMFAVKKGKASSTLCYAIDQSLVSLKKLKYGETKDFPEIEQVGLWFILENKTHLNQFDDVHVDLSSLKMLMLKNRIDQWSKEVRLAGYKPVIYINYKC